MPRTAGHGLAPYGYRLETHTEAIPVPHEQAVLTLIAHLRRRGWTMPAIAEQLNALEFRRRDGGPFTKQTVHDVLRRAGIDPAEQLADTG